MIDNANSNNQNSKINSFRHSAISLTLCLILLASYIFFRLSGLNNIIGFLIELICVVALIFSIIALIKEKHHKILKIVCIAFSGFFFIAFSVYTIDYILGILLKEYLLR